MDVSTLNRSLKYLETTSNHQDILNGARSKFVEYREAVAKNVNIPKEAFQILMDLNSNIIDRLIAKNVNIPKSIALHFLNSDKTKTGVMYALLKNKGLTNEVLRIIGKKSNLTRARIGCNLLSFDNNDLNSHGLLGLIQEHPNSDLGLKNSLILDFTIVRIMYSMRSGFSKINV